MSESENTIDQAFKAARQYLGESNESSREIEERLDQGVNQALPELSKYTFSLHQSYANGIKFNRYQIIKKVGSGGMGEVYLAQRTDGQVDKKVAIKILSHGFFNEDIKERFFREKQILADLRHPGIVPLIDAGTTEDNIPWFALEYIDGSPIHQFAEDQQLSLEARVQMISKICDALQFAHGQGIIHRDIKPANILVEKIEGSFNPVILDFGIAHVHGNKKLTSQGNLIGTPNYMSPEQILGSKFQVDRRTDVFSLGVVLFRLLTNQLPFEAESAVETYDKILNHSPTPINLPGFPKDLQIIIDSCLKKNPIERYQSVQELKNDLQNWLSGYPIKAKKEKLSARVWHWYKRNKLLSTALLVMISTLTLFGVKYAIDINNERQLAIESKIEADDLLNFVLEDLHQQLTEIGRVDVLETVAVKSLSHINKYRKLIDHENQMKQATIYQNLADVLTMQSDNSKSIAALEQAKSLLFPLLEIEDKKQQASAILASSMVDLANLYAKQGKLAKASEEYVQALDIAYQIDAAFIQPVDLPDDLAQTTQWQVHNAYAWNLMEETRFPEAQIQLDLALNLAEQQLAKNISSTWQQNKLKTLTTYGWFYNAKRELKSSQKTYLKALDLAQTIYDDAPNSTSAINGLQRVLNQLAYTYAVDQNTEDSLKYAKMAKTIGIRLHNKAPENKIYYRALAYTYTTLGDGYKKLGQSALATENFYAGLKITESLAANAPDNASLQNDLAIDNMNYGQLLIDDGQIEQGHKHWQIAEKAIAPFAEQENASIYYVDTYATVLLMQNKFALAEPFLMVLKNSDGWGSQTYDALVEKYNLGKDDDN